MAFPPQGATVFENAESAHEARTAWAAVAHAILDFEPVSMIVDPADHAAARTYLSREIELFEAPLDDAWTLALLVCVGVLKMKAMAPGSRPTLVELPNFHAAQPALLVPLMPTS